MVWHMGGARHFSTLSALRKYLELIQMILLFDSWTNDNCLIDLTLNKNCLIHVK